MFATTHPPSHHHHPHPPAKRDLSQGMLQPKTGGIKVCKPKETIANQNQSKNKHLGPPQRHPDLPGLIFPNFVLSARYSIICPLGLLFVCCLFCYITYIFIRRYTDLVSEYMHKTCTYIFFPRSPSPILSSYCCYSFFVIFTVVTNNAKGKGAVASKKGFP